MLRLASASTPGSKRRFPSFNAASRSMVPTTLSSDALMGSSTTRIRRVVTGRGPLSARSRQSRQKVSGSSGRQPKWQPSTTCWSGSSRASARTAVDLAVPFSPRISTPPIAGLMALRTRASFMRSCPTIAVKGNEYRSRATATNGSEPPEATGTAAASALQLAGHRGGDLLAREVVQAVVAGAHALGQVGARVDRVGLVHGRDPGQVLHRGQVAEV